MPPTTIKGIEQGRATYAYACVEAAKTNLSPDNQKKYKSYAKKLPMMIKANGLGAAIAFALSKSDAARGDTDPWNLLYKQINTWMRNHKAFLLGEQAPQDLAAAVISRDSIQYRALTVEIIALLTWLRRFAEGLIEGEADQ